VIVIARGRQRSAYEAEDHERVAVLAGQLDGDLWMADLHSRRPALSLASSVLAAASTRIALLAASAYAPGLHGRPFHRPADQDHLRRLAIVEQLDRELVCVTMPCASMVSFAMGICSSVVDSLGPAGARYTAGPLFT
jgi:hypothetical protein